MLELINILAAAAAAGSVVIAGHWSPLSGWLAHRPLAHHVARYIIAAGALALGGVIVSARAALWILPVTAAAVGAAAIAWAIDARILRDNARRAREIRDHARRSN